MQKVLVSRTLTSFLHPGHQARKGAIRPAHRIAGSWRRVMALTQSVNATRLLTLGQSVAALSVLKALGSGRTQPLKNSVKRCFRSTPTESNFKSPNLCADSTSAIRKTEKGYEEGCARGGRLSATKPAGTPVNAKRRELPLSACRVSCLFRKGLRPSARRRKSLRFERAEPGCGGNRGGCFRSPESRSKTLGRSV